MHQKSVSMSTKDVLGIKLKSDYERFYNIKGWCDALDYTGVWRLGRIKKSDDNFVLVHFDGWSEKWKQWYCKHSPTIAPLRTHTAGYTGQISVALRDYEFQMDIVQTSERKLKLLLHDDKLSGFDAFRLTSFVRGDLFVLIDSILTLNDRIEAQECHQISSFMKCYINMVLKWMKLVVPTYQAMRRELRIDNVHYLEEIQSKRMHVISKDISLYMCGVEIFISLKSIMGLEARSSIFYDKNTLTLNSKDLINHFLSNEGLQKLNELLAYEDKEIPNGRIDFTLLWPLIYSIPFIFNKVPWMPWEKPIQKFIEIMYMRLKKEFECDRQFKNKLEKTGEFVNFIQALEKLNSYVNEGGFLFDTLFDHGDLGFDDDGIDFSSVSMIDQMIAGRPTTVVHHDHDHDHNHDGDSVVITDDEGPSKPAMKLPSEEISQIQPSPVDNQEAMRLKEEILAMQKQMLEIKKGLDVMIKNQDEQKLNLAKSREEKLKAERLSVQTKKMPMEIKNDFLTSIKNSGITPKELSVYLGYFKQINQTMKNDKKQDKVPKSRSEIEEENRADGAGLGTCDDELKVLTALEMNLANNKLADALKMIKWRKKVIKLAHMSGWEIATTIASKTVNKLDIDAVDILTSNVNFLPSSSQTNEPRNLPEVYDEQEEEQESGKLVEAARNDIVMEKYEPSEEEAGEEEQEEYYEDRISQQRDLMRESTTPLTTGRFTEIRDEIKEEASDDSETQEE